MPFIAFIVYSKQFPLLPHKMIILVHITLCVPRSLFPLLYKHTSRHLFHEDLDVSILRNGAQILNNVPVLQVLVEGNLFMKRLRVPDSQRQKDVRFIPFIYPGKIALSHLICYSINLLHIFRF